MEFSFDLALELKNWKPRRAFIALKDYYVKPSMLEDKDSFDQNKWLALDWFEYMGRDEFFEKCLLKWGSARVLFRYICIFRFRWPEAEPKIFEDLTGAAWDYMLFLYSEIGLRERLPLLEENIKRGIYKTSVTKKYLEILLKYKIVDSEQANEICQELVGEGIWRLW